MVLKPVRITFVVLGLGCLLLGILLPCWSVADVVRLKGGGQVEGKVVGKRDGQLIVKVPFGTITISQEDVEAVVIRGSTAFDTERQGHLREAGKLAGLIADAEAALNAEPDSPALKEKLVHAYRAQAQAYLKAGFIARGETALKRCLELSPDDADIKRALGLFQEARARKEGLAKEAEVLLEVGEYQKALDELNVLTELFPESKGHLSALVAEAHIGVGDELLHAKQASQAARHYDAAVRMDPQVATRIKDRWVSAHLRPLIEEITSLPEGASPIRSRLLVTEQKLRRILNFAPGSMHTHYTLGVVCEFLGHPEEAARHYEKVLGLEAGKGALAIPVVRQRKSALAVVKLHPLKTSFETGESRFVKSDPGDWQELRSAHFLVHHHNRELAEKVKDASEFHYRRIRKRLVGPEASRAGACEIFIYRDKQEYLKQSGEPAWSPATTQWQMKGGKLSQRLLTYQTSPLLLEAVLPHELGHVTLNALVKDVEHLPLWLSEGVAIAQEPDFKHNYFWDLIRQGIKTGDCYSLDELLQRRAYPPEGGLHLFYAQCWVLVEILKEQGGWQKVVELARVSTTRPTAEAVKQVYGLEFSELKELFQRRVQAG